MYINEYNQVFRILFGLFDSNSFAYEFVNFEFVLFVVIIGVALFTCFC